MTSLNQRQQKALRKRLTERRRQIVQDIREALARSDAELAAKLSDRVRDAGDESVADFLEALDAALVDRDVQELRDIEAALARLEAGEIDRCVDCGGEIGFERLQAFPTAIRCVQCQAVYERTHAGSAGSSL
ncbi:TraR/DksA family transcriptional regulator [Pelomicrobium sp. G1]|uniref:TraR/DksA family transcriptional regulator n=1 Tax=unclassified Pelomicrobium TaxID=2815318 RepID=UPI003F762C59